MLLFDRRNWRVHRPWFLFFLLATIGSTAWYWCANLGAARWPGGSSVAGWVFGIPAGLIMIFELLLWWRKKVRVWRIGRAQAWLRAHIWLGLLTVPLILYHSGFHFTQTFTNVMMVLFAIVILSGIYGLTLQQFIPARMLDEVPAETIYSQIEHVSKQISIDAGLLVQATCGPEEGEELAAVGSAAAMAETAGHLTLGAVRSAGMVQGKVLQTSVPTAPIPDSEALRVFFRKELRPYLEKGARSQSPLQQRNRAVVMFRELRTRLSPEAGEVVDALENCCDQRRQFDVQARLHWWLHSWLCIHLPLSVALIALMFAHVFFALKFSGTPKL